MGVDVDDIYIIVNLFWGFLVRCNMKSNNDVGIGFFWYILECYFLIYEVLRIMIKIVV